MKIERVNSELQKQIALVIDNELRNPLIKEGMLTVTRVKTTPDLKYAKVNISIYCDDAAQKKDILDAVNGAAGFIRNQLKNTVKIRILPELKFEIDDSIDYGSKIEAIIRTLK